METIKLLNIPNFYSSYYLLGLTQEFKVKYKNDINFSKFNNKPILIFQINDKIAVIDNDDPCVVNQELYELVDIYFTTNKLIDNDSYNQKKVIPLFPHYPINIVPLYFALFRLNLVRHLKFIDLARQIYILLRRPFYKQHEKCINKGDFIFFSSNIWKKEPHTNQIRAEFIRFCKADPRIDFKGGFVSRSDGNNYGFENELNSVKYSPKTFSKLSAMSKVALNNPAVCGAVSWRLAEYLNQGLFVLTFPFKIELPQSLRQDLEVKFIENTNEYQEVFDEILNNQIFYKTIATNGKIYFDTYCTPMAQAKYIVEAVLNSKTN
jgi:hypothetical protein